jgi:hypothetical protein
LNPVKALRVALENFVAKLGDQSLTSKNYEEDPDEREVGFNSREYVELIVYFTATNHVEDLHHNECCKDECEVS